MDKGATPSDQAPRLWRDGLSSCFANAWPPVSIKQNSTSADYRGRHHALETLLGVPWHTIKKWDKGERAMPLWARKILCNYLRARGRRDLELADHIERLPLPTRHRPTSQVARELGSRGAAARHAKYLAGMRWKNKKGARRKRAPDSSETR